MLLSEAATPRPWPAGGSASAPARRECGTGSTPSTARSSPAWPPTAGTDVFRVRSANLACWRSDVLAVNGFDEDFVGWGREDSDFVARLQHSGLTRLHLKFAAIGYHLWHPEASRQALPQNQRILEETLATRRIRCAHGIDRHLGGAA